MLTLETRLADITGGYIGRTKQCKCKGPFLKNVSRMVHSFGWVGLRFFSCGAVGYSLLLEETPCSEPFACSAYILDMFGKSTKQKWLMHGESASIMHILFAVIWLQPLVHHCFIIDWIFGNPIHLKSRGLTEIAHEQRKRAPGCFGYIGDKIMS